MSPPPEVTELHELFGAWVDSELKAQMVSFYNRNPGVIETLEGLAHRLGLRPEGIRQAVADHVRLGVLVERRLGDKPVLMLNRDRRGAIEQIIMRNLKARAEAA